MPTWKVTTKWRGKHKPIVEYVQGDDPMAIVSERAGLFSQSADWEGTEVNCRPMPGPWVTAIRAVVRAVFGKRRP